MKKDPQKFRVGKKFAVVALKTFLSGITTNLQRLSAGDFAEDRALIIARDIENALIEKQHSHVVFRKEIERILSSEHEHKKLLDEKIRLSL